MSSNNAAGEFLDPQRWDEEHRAYDWQVFTRKDEVFYKRALGRTNDREQSRKHVTEALRSLPDGVHAHGEILRTNVLAPDVLQLIEVAVRTKDGSIDWTRL